MQRLEVSGAVRPLYGSLGVKGLTRSNQKHKPAVVYEITLTTIFYVSLILWSLCDEFIVFDLKISPCFECWILSFGRFCGVLVLPSDVSEHPVVTYQRLNLCTDVSEHPVVTYRRLSLYTDVSEQPVVTCWRLSIYTDVSEHPVVTCWRLSLNTDVSEHPHVTWRWLNLYTDVSEHTVLTCRLLKFIYRSFGTRRCNLPASEFI